MDDFNTFLNKNIIWDRIIAPVFLTGLAAYLTGFHSFETLSSIASISSIAILFIVFLIYKYKEILHIILKNNIKTISIIANLIIPPCAGISGTKLILPPSQLCKFSEDCSGWTFVGKIARPKSNPSTFYKKEINPTWTNFLSEIGGLNNCTKSMTPTRIRVTKSFLVENALPLNIADLVPHEAKKVNECSLDSARCQPQSKVEIKVNSHVKVDMCIKDGRDQKERFEVWLHVKDADYTR